MHGTVKLGSKNSAFIAQTSWQKFKVLITQSRDDEKLWPISISLTSIQHRELVNKRNELIQSLITNRETHIELSDNFVVDVVTLDPKRIELTKTTASYETLHPNGFEVTIPDTVKKIHMDLDGFLAWNDRAEEIQSSLEESEKDAMHEKAVHEKLKVAMQYYTGVSPSFASHTMHQGQPKDVKRIVEDMFLLAVAAIVQKRVTQKMDAENGLGQSFLGRMMTYTAFEVTKLQDLQINIYTVMVNVMYGTHPELKISEWYNFLRDFSSCYLKCSLGIEKVQQTVYRLMDKSFYDYESEYIRKILVEYDALDEK